MLRRMPNKLFQPSSSSRSTPPSRQELPGPLYTHQSPREPVPGHPWQEISIQIPACEPQTSNFTCFCFLIYLVGMLISTSLGGRMKINVCFIDCKVLNKSETLKNV